VTLAIFESFVPPLTAATIKNYPTTLDGGGGGGGSTQKCASSRKRNEAER
jgi:hypothetical protein